MRIKREEKQLLEAIKSVPSVVHRGVIIKALSDPSLDICRRHLTLFLEGKKTGYKLSKEESEALKKGLFKHRKRLRAVIENRSQRGGQINTRLISILLPLVADVIGKYLSSRKNGQK